MTTARRSWRRGSALSAIVAGLTAVAIAPASAHRLDEYLQAARIAIEPGRLQIDLDLTPGVSLAPRVVSEIDRDGNGVIASDEASAYAARVLSEVRLEIDGRPLPLGVIDHQFPAVAAMLKGEGTIQLRLTAAVPPLAAGTHLALYRNDHHPDIGVYLANALVPASDRIAVLAQTRDIDQRALVIEYALRDAPVSPRLSWLAAATGGATVMVAAVLWRRSRTRHGRSDQ